MTTTTPEYPAEGFDGAKPRLIEQVRDRADHWFRGITTGGGALVLVIMVLVFAFLTIQSWQALQADGFLKFVTNEHWSPESTPPDFGIAAILTGTALIAVVALVIGFPLALGTALYITEIAGGRMRRLLTTVIDLMAAVPSVVYGIWGLSFFEPVIVPFAIWLSKWFGWIPIFAVTPTDPANPVPDQTLYESSTFIAGLVVGLMIVPTMTSLMRESFSRAPIGEREGALALGSTRWGMIREVVLPFGRGGVIGATMLGLGRALGETIAIYFIISPLFAFNFQILSKGSISISALIALRYGEAGQGSLSLSALMAAGLALFIVTLVINFTASTIIARSRSGADAEG